MAQVKHGWSKDAIHQGLLENVVRAIFKGEHILNCLHVETNARKKAKIKNPSTGAYLELDVWVPKLHICFEFQDPYHYISTWDSQSPLELIQQNDDLKKQMILGRGESLVIVPCWWDGTVGSLISTIQFVRPDLLLNNKKATKLISLLPPQHFFSGGSIPDVGELMLASFPLSSHFNYTISPEESWWMGEKYDGIRFCWNTLRYEVYTRSGARLSLPPSFVDKLPDDGFLDGEIWFGKGCFADSQRLTSSDGQTIPWESLRFVVFDEPAPELQDRPFEARYMHLLSSFDSSNPCISPKHLAKASQELIADGGEGVILRKPESIYEPGRSTSLLKVKASRGDREALVVTVYEDKSVMLQLPDGTHFSVPAEASLDVTPQRGDVVTFMYNSYSRKSVPTQPKLLRIRTDISWEEILRDYAEQAPQKQDLNAEARGLLGVAPKPYKFWSSEKGKNMRAFFERFAKSVNRDPLDPHSWYDVRQSSLLTLKGGKTVLTYYGGSHIRALMDLFPDIGLEKSKFHFIPRRFWDEMKNRKRFFLEFAKSEKFDPLEPENWYNIPLAKINAYKGAFGAMAQYDNDFTKALVHVFPDIGLDPSKFSFVSRKYWLVSDRKALFEEYARANGFDPNLPKNWYAVTKDQILEFKDISLVLGYYNGSLKNALLNLFPGLDKSLLSSLPRNYWKDENNQRAVFETIAKEKKFDPLIADNWYNLKYDDVKSAKGGSNVLSYYKGSHVKALVQLFPDIGLAEHKFPIIPRHFWTDYTNLRRFFVVFARDRGFNPLKARNWYTISRDEIISAKGGTSVIRRYGGMVEALVHALPEVNIDPSKFVNMPHLQWRHPKTRRKFFESFANEKGFDPLNPNRWYTVTLGSVLAKKGANVLLSFYENSLAKAVADVFPEVNFDKTKFMNKQQRFFWQDEENRKKFFLAFAREQEFDPQVPENWYNVKISDITASRGGRSVLNQSEGNLGKALMQIFPQVAFDESQFVTLSSEYWDDVKNQRAVFESFAKHKTFDPLIAQNWYPYSRDSIAALRGGSVILSHYGSFMKALISLFPEVQFDELKFSILPRFYWQDKANRRKIFDQFAKSKQFDALMPENWYPIIPSALGIKASPMLHDYYENNLSKALMDVYPEVSFNTDKFIVNARKASLDG